MGSLPIGRDTLMRGMVGILGIRIRLDNQVESPGRITRRGGSASPASNRAD